MEHQEDIVQEEEEEEELLFGMRSMQTVEPPHIDLTVEE